MAGTLRELLNELLEVERTTNANIRGMKELLSLQKQVGSVSTGQASVRAATIPAVQSISTTGASTSFFGPKNVSTNFYATAEQEVRKRLTSFLFGAATGGAPDPAKIEKYVNDIMGGIQVAGRKRVGGGARIDFDRYMNEINQTWNETILELINLRHEQIKTEIRQSLSKTTPTAIPAGQATTNDIFRITDKFPETPETSKSKGDSYKYQSAELKQQILLQQELGKIEQAAAKESERIVKETSKSKLTDIKIVTAELKQQILLQQQVDRLEKAADKESTKISRDSTKEKLAFSEAINRELEQQRMILREIDKLDAQQKISYTPDKIEGMMGQYRGQKLLQQAQKYGFGTENIKQIYTQQPSGVTVGKFENVDANTGAVNKLELTVDKFGHTLVRTNRRLLSFTDSIVRNTQEVLKWSIGVGLVYGAMYKLQNLIRLAIENETKLADIAVILGDAQRNTNRIFEEAAKVANETGESINAVLDTYVLAYRAVGSIEDPVKRTSSAIQLLTDATILNKLSSLDASTSIDVLSGSLRQLQKPGEDMTTAFSRGRDLLDAWVTVTRKANVDLNTLATAFSITSESATNAGVSVEQLNAIIAVLAEKIGGLGGRETGNAVRALIGGVYQQQAADILTRYGIAVQDTAGRMRSFLDISEEIYTLYKEDVISPDELNKIGYVLGGGVRRGQQYVAYLSDRERIQEIVNAQIDREGAAQEALGRKVATTQTAITRLGNAFQSLAQTLGTDGGVLDSLKNILETATNLVDIFNKLTSILGKLTVPATLLGITSLVFRGGEGKLRQANMAANVGGVFQRFATAGAGVVPGYKVPYAVTDEAGHTIGSTTKAAEFGRTAGLAFGKFGTGAIVGSMPAIMRLVQGDLKGAGVDLGGAILGSLATGGSPIGALIGSMIADTLVSQTLEHKPDFEALFADVFGTAIEDTEDELTDLQKKQAKVTADIFKEAGGGNALRGVAAGRFSAFAFNILEMQKTGQMGRMTPEQGALAFGQLRGSALGRPNQNLINETAKLRAEQELITPIKVSEETTKSSTVEKQRLNLIEQQAALVEQIVADRQKELKIQSALSQISPKQQVDISKTLQGLDAAVSKVYIAFGESFDKANKSVEGLDQTYKALSDVLIEGTEEQRIELVQYASEWAGLTAAIEAAQNAGRNYVETISGDKLEIGGKGGAQEQADNLKRISTDFAILLRQEQELAKVKIPTIVGMEDIKSIDAFNKVYNEALKIQEEYFDTWIREKIMTPEQANIILSKWEKIAVDLGDIFGIKVVEGLTDPIYLNKAFDKFKDEVSKANLGFEKFDVTQQVLERTIKQSEVMGKNLSQYGYQYSPEDLIAITNEGFVKPQRADWKIVQYLLQQILDTEKKQLDGIYNLPEGAGFYVPYQTLGLAYQKGLNEATGGGTGNIQELIYQNQDKYKTQAPLISDLVRGNVDMAGTVAKEVTKTISKVYLPQIKVPPYYGTEEEKFRGRTIPQEEKPSFIEKADNWLESFKKGFPDWFKEGETNPFSTGGGLDLKSLFDTIGQKLSTNFNLSITSTSTIVVDGRVLAEVIKPYLQSDLIRYENTAGAINRVVAI